MHLIWCHILGFATLAFLALYLVIITLLIKLYNLDRSTPSSLYCSTKNNSRKKKKRPKPTEYKRQVITSSYLQSGGRSL